MFSKQAHIIPFFGFFLHSKHKPAAHAELWPSLSSIPLTLPNNRPSERSPFSHHKGNDDAHGKKSSPPCLRPPEAACNWHHCFIIWDPTAPAASGDHHRQSTPMSSWMWVTASTTQTWTQVQRHTSYLDPALEKGLHCQRDHLPSTTPGWGHLGFCQKNIQICYLQLFLWLSSEEQQASHTHHLIDSYRVKKRLRSIILVLESRNRSVFLHTPMHPEAPWGWLPHSSSACGRLQ